MKAIRTLWVAAILLSAGASHAANGLQVLYGTVMRTLADISGTVTSPVGDILVGTAQVAGSWLANTVVRIQGRYVTIPRGTAAFEISFTSGGETRRMLVIRPEPARADAPVMLMLHGNGGTGENQANLSSVGNLVATTGIWAVMPDALNGTWDDDPGNALGIGDVAFLSSVIEIMTSNFLADAERVYVAGMSNGAFMAERLACERSDLIAGAAVIAGTITGELARSCSPASPRPILFVAGTADPIVPYDGSRLGLQSAEAAFSAWLTWHNCLSSASTTVALPDIAFDGTTVSLTRNSACGSGGEVRLYTVNGGGHAWPGGWQYLPIPIIGRTSEDINATQEIWDFVSAYTR